MIPIDSGNIDVSTAKAGPLGLQGKFSPDDISEYINPPADARLNSIIQKTGSPLRQGIIQQQDDAIDKSHGQKFPYACRFMFNPPGIQVSYAADLSQLTPNTQTPAQTAGSYIGPGQTNFSFNLLFDRTYEVAYGPTISPTIAADLRNIGVYRDIGALESIVNARNNFAANPSDIMQNMSLVPVYIIFGGGNGGQNGAPVAGLSYSAYITSMEVTYSLFSSKMVPTRAGVALGCTLRLGSSALDINTSGGTLVDRSTSTLLPAAK